ncbi:MAG: atpC [Candidatus Saccharibacteria bacterium]|nr:atpC [Candidatus Saccharibacteria bacterium]MDB5180492.1 atpC [Candidatus Saccharibacteria bacterium]
MAEDTPAEVPSETEQLAAVADPKKPTIDIKVYAPFKVYYEGVGYSLSAVNETGPFDVLPKHHNFLCMLVPCDLKIQTLEGEKIIKISRALMHVKANRVVVFVDV